MLSLSRKARADAPGAVKDVPAGAEGGLVLPRPLRKPVRHFMRLFNHGILFSPSALAMLTGLVAGGAGIVWLNESAQGDRMVAQATAWAGFRIGDIEVSGAHETSRIDILTSIDLGTERSLFSFDVHQAREKIRQLPWVADVRVWKSYPDRLLVEVVERSPFAVWQHQGKLSLVERDGRVIAPFEERFTGLPLVVGEGAAAAAAEIVTAASRQPGVASRVVAYVRVGERRWNLTLDNGQTVLLPEGGEAAQLAELARLQGEQDLFGRELTQIDMRLPDRLVLRLSPDAAKALREEKAVKTSGEKDT